MRDLPALEDLDVSGKRVLLRGDLNVPLRDGRVTDDARIRALVPTVADLRERGASVILMSHFGRPKGRAVDGMSLAPLLPALAAALGVTPAFAADCIGKSAEDAAAALKPGDILLLENLRFHPGEEANDPAFATALARLGDVYVNDAFSTAHRAHASTHRVARLLPAAAGRHLHAELAVLDRVLENPARPVGAVIGGAKISSKLPALVNLVKRADWLAIGGAMANSFLQALGTPVGVSLSEPERKGDALDILARADAAGCEILLPSDVVIRRGAGPEAVVETRPAGAVPPDGAIMDIGPASAGLLAARLRTCRTLLWNGPLGAFETPPFDSGTRAVAQAAAEQTRQGRLLSVAGGGDTAAALAAAGVEGGFSHLSTGGGAFLEWLEGRDLPGVAVLRRGVAV